MAPGLTDSLPTSIPDVPAGKMNGLAPASRHEEYQYLDLVREVLETGEHRPDRCVARSRQSFSVV